MLAKRFLVTVIVVGCIIGTIGYAVAEANHTSRVWPLILGFGLVLAAALCLRGTRKGP